MPNLRSRPSSRAHIKGSGRASKGTYVSSRALASAASAGLLVAFFIAPGCADTEHPARGAQVPSEPFAASASPVVYGEDDRRDVYDHPDPRLRAIAAQSIVALVSAGRLDMADPSDIGFSAQTLGEARRLCDGERFADQPALANCSGTLIDRDIVLTAGHCVTSQAACKGTAFVFNFYMASEGELATITADDVYTCRELLVQRDRDGIDYALVQLDRPVSLGRSTVPIRDPSDELSIGAPVTIIGFGSGLPAKIDSGGVVLDPRSGSMDYFRASVDAFGGNSGSGVFDADGNVAGILVRGASDYERRGSCNVVSVLPETGGAGHGEDIVYVHRAIDALCDGDRYVGPLCPGGPSRCALCDDSPDCDREDDVCVAAQSGGGADDDDEVLDPPRYCAAACASAADCPAYHACEDDRCVPVEVLICRGDDVVAIDGCGEVLRHVATCDDGTICRDGECVEPATGDRCSAPIMIPAVSGVYEGSLDDAFTASLHGSCGGSGREIVFEMDVPHAMSLVATSTGFDTVLYARTACEDASSEIACNDDARPPGGRGSRVSVDLDPGTVYLVLDSYGATSGDYRLSIDLTSSCPCELGEVVCAGTARQTCVEAGDGCPSFGEPVACDSDETCLFGACIPGGRGDSCDDPIEIDARSGSLSGTTAREAGGLSEGSCGGAGPEHVYAFSVAAAVDFRAVSSDADIVLYLRRSCEDEATETACSVRGRRDAIIERSLAPGTYFLFVDHRVAGADYTVDVTFDGACESTCDVPGARRCAGVAAIEICVDVGADGCFSWERIDTCSAGSTCDDARCVPDPDDGPDTGHDADAPDAGDTPDDADGSDTDAPTDGATAQRGGCVATGATASPGRGAAGLGVFLLALVAVRRTGRRIGGAG